MTGKSWYSTKAGLIRTWSQNGFYLELYETNVPTDRGIMGHTYIAYRFWDYQYGGSYNGEPIFTGNDFGRSPMHSEDSDMTVADLLLFLSLRKGDTDSEYFDKYTPRQLEWRDQRAEELSMLAMELEESANMED